MRTFALAAAVSLLMGGMALGQSQIIYDLELDADQQKLADYVAAWEDTGFPPAPNPQYVPAAGGVTQVSQGDIVTWDATVSSGGSHGGVPGDWDADANNFSQINGVANLVFDLELREGTVDGPLVQDAVFYSAINDGDFSRAANDDPKELAAFTHIGYHGDANDYPGNPISGGPPSAGAGRLFDATTQGGVGMDRIQYPSGVDGEPGSATLGQDHPGGRRTGTVPPNHTPGVAVAGFPIGGAGALNGKLIGMGAGYSQFSFSTNVAGVGIDINGAGEPYAGTGFNGDALDGFGTYRGLAPRPVVEGQINTGALQPGTYCLVLKVPSDVDGDGQSDVDQTPLNNIFTGEALVDSGAVDVLPFGLPADEVFGDNICFDVEGGFELVSWESEKTHGTGTVDAPFDALAITLDHTVDFATPPDPAVTTVEARRFDGTGKELEDFIIVTFSDDITANGYVADQAAITSVAGNGSATGSVQIASETVSGANNELLVLELEIVGETQNFEAYCVTIDLSSSIPGLPDSDCKFRIQYGNTAGGTPQDLNTNLIDFAETKGNSGVSVVNPGNPQYDPTKLVHDWNLDGNVNLIDAGEVKSRSAKSSIPAGCSN